MPRGENPVTISLEKCIELIEASLNKPASSVMKEFEGGIQVINGNYGPYIKYDGGNYRIPKGTEAESLTLEDVKKIIAEGHPTGRKYRKK